MNGGKLSNVCKTAVILTDAKLISMVKYDLLKDNNSERHSFEAVSEIKKQLIIMTST